MTFLCHLSLKMLVQYVPECFFVFISVGVPHPHFHLWPLCGSSWSHLIELRTPRVTAPYRLRPKPLTYTCVQLADDFFPVVSFFFFECVKMTARQRRKYSRHVFLFVYDGKFPPALIAEENKIRVVALLFSVSLCFFFYWAETKQRAFTLIY